MMKSIPKLGPIKLTIVLTAAVFVALIYGGLTALQLALLLVFCTFLIITEKGNDHIYKTLSMIFRDDLSAPAFGRLQDQLGWAFGPLIVLSVFYPWVAAGLSLGLTALYARPIAMWRRAEQDAGIAKERALEKIAADPFDVVFYVAGPKASAYQINQWLPVAERMNLKSAICLRNFELLETIDETTIPICFARTAEDVERLKDTAGASVFLYPANPQSNMQALRHTEIQHYFINHGESDKVVNQSKFLMAYDKLLVAGPLAKQRLKASNLPLRDNQIEYVGVPSRMIALTLADRRFSWHVRF